MTGFLQVVRQRAVQGTTEKNFELRLGKALNSLGLLNWHTHELNLPGVPDRYVVGGNWIECKVRPWTGKKGFGPRKCVVKESQINFLNRLVDNGDRAWLCILLKAWRTSGRGIILPWEFVRETDFMSKEEILTWPLYTTGFEEAIASRFGKQFEGNSNYGEAIKAGYNFAYKA